MDYGDAGIELIDLVTISRVPGDDGKERPSFRDSADSAIVGTNEIARAIKVVGIELAVHKQSSSEIGTSPGFQSFADALVRKGQVITGPSCIADMPRLFLGLAKRCGCP